MGNKDARPGRSRSQAGPESSPNIANGGNVESNNQAQFFRKYKDNSSSEIHASFLE